MSLVCSRITVTWHDGVWPSTAGSRTLLAAGEKVEEGSLLSGAVEQAVQRADHVRAASPVWWPRGGRASVLEWERARPAARHDAALALALSEASLPAGRGWVLVALQDYGRQWVATPAAVRRGEWRYDLRSGHLLQRWSIDAGPLTEIATTAEDGALTLEIGTEILTEDGGHYLALES